MNPDLDNKLQREQVWELMKDGRWRTLFQIKHLLGTKGGRHYGECSISARLRDFRKHSYGGFTVERRRAEHATGRLYEYRIVVPITPTQLTLSSEVRA
jgi:hypothetical protein